MATMPVPSLSPLIIATACLCLLASLGGSDAECCTTMANLKFMIASGNCGEVNAQRRGGQCEVTVCGDGTALEGNFCGRGPCNFVGCNCEGGCRHGNYGQSFLARNQGRVIALMETEIVNIGVLSPLWGTGLFKF